MGWTNKGLRVALEKDFRESGGPTTTFNIVLITSAASPNVDMDTFSGLTEIAAGNGYTSGGYALAMNSTDFDTIDDDNTNNWGTIEIKDVVWTASGGPIPASGSGARYAVLTDDNATLASREVYAWWDLASDRSVTDGQTLTLQDLELRLAST